MRSAPLFQLMILPSNVFPMTASLVDSTIEARKEMVLSASRWSRTKADKDRKVIAITATKTCNSRRDSFRLLPAKGPNPRVVPQAAIPDNTGMAVATPRGPSLNAAHNIIGMVRCPIGVLYRTTPPKIRTATDDIVSNSAPPSNQRSTVHLSKGLSAQVRKSGPATRAPVPSPSHHVNHSDPK